MITPARTPALDRGRRHVCALLGSGITESLTPRMHEAAAERHGLTLIYRVVDLEVLGLTAQEGVDLVPRAAQLGLSGMNITHPCKQLVLPVLDELSPEAALIGAVNTVVFTSGRIVGHNTDMTGFAHGFRRDLGNVDLSRVIQFGGGGAGSAVAHALAALGAEGLLIVDPEHSRATELAASVESVSSLRVTAVAPEDAPAAMRLASGVVNCTPVGMAAHPGTPFPTSLLHPDQWVCDVIYRPLVSELISQARQRGCRTATGAGMAVGQAVESFALFTGTPPEPEGFEQDFHALVDAERQAHATS
ncbi:MAG: shikimate dehydrogenase [Ornithinimicrobium sp.]|uniref:shikimate dehydrogenase n=1 Tax=Ornithinimicrobium sp. TaxID=1977084 RepID=UPI0026DFB7D5|nr:shikimate dehydrogenase [Ornithinimicrobium sp.]MDO5739986.1 shikimate dehydrogenase [Ornithinimicrobium sp.]